MKLVDITCIILVETDKALRVDHGDDEPVWLPKSQIEIEPNRDGKTVTVTMPEWLAIEKELV